jgi:hypothetical protein
MQLENDELIRIVNLKVSFHLDEGLVQALDGIDLSIKAGSYRHQEKLMKGRFCSELSLEVRMARSISLTWPRLKRTVNFCARYGADRYR